MTAWTAWDDLCACGHAAVRHDHSPTTAGRAVNLAGPCHWCPCTAWTPPTTAEEAS